MINLFKRLIKPLKFSNEEQVSINLLIDRFLKYKIIEPVTETAPNEFVSNIFFRPKKGGKIRIILNHKTINSDYLEKQHFKIGLLQSAINAMRKSCFVGSVDFVEAFYSIPIHKTDKKYFGSCTNILVSLTHLPQVFTKILKTSFGSSES